MKTIGIALLCTFLLPSCALKVFLNDRQTVLEDEAAGAWPDFEKELLNKSIARGPTPFPKTEISAKNARLYQILNGELVSEKSGVPSTQATNK